MEDERSEDVFEVADIIDAKISKGQPLYRVRWKGFDDTHDTWEPRENLLTCDAILERFMKTRCPKSVRECINFIIDESQRKAKKTKSKVAVVIREKKELEEVRSEDSFVFSSGSDHIESPQPVGKLSATGNSLDKEVETICQMIPSANEKVAPEQETRAERAFFVPATNLELSTHDQDDFPLSLKELTLMGGTRSETRKIVAVSGEKSFGNRRSSAKAKKTKVVVKNLEVGRRPRGRPRKHKPVVEVEMETGTVLVKKEEEEEEEEKVEKKQTFVFKEIEEKRDEVVDEKDDDRDETSNVISPKRKKARIIEDEEDDSELEEEKSDSDSMCVDGKPQSVSNRGLFDIFASPDSDAHTGTAAGEDSKEDKNGSAENGMSHLSGSTAGKLADETDLVVVPSVDDSPTKSLEHSPEDVSSPSPDIELVETIEDSKPADSDLLEFDFDDFSPDEDSDTETGEKNTIGTETSEEGVSFAQLKQAVREGDVDTVRRALNANCDVDQADGINGMTLLMWAAMEGQVEVAALLSRTADVNAKQRNGSTSLMVAAEQGFDNICEILIEAGAHLNLAQQTGETALMKAAKKGHVGTVNLLLRKGVDFRALSSFGHSASSYAQRNHHLEVQTMIGHHATRVTRIFEGKAGEIASRDYEVLVMPPLLPPTLRIPSELSKMDFSISLTPDHKLDGCEVNLFVLTVELDVDGGIAVGELPPVTQYNFSCHFSGGRVSWKNASVCLLPSLSPQNKLEFLAAGFKSHKNVLALGVYGVKRTRISR